MLSAFPSTKTPADAASNACKALWGVAAFDFDPARYVSEGTITKADADWAYNLRSSIQAERSAPDADEWEIVRRVMHKASVRLGLATA